MTDANKVNKVDSVEDKKSIPTDVILVVKGAGDQKPDDHLGLFLSGFWPAVLSIDPSATIHQKQLETEDLKPTPHNKDPHKHYTEILATVGKGESREKKRIWVKEAYWEHEVLPSNPLANLLKEWKMASYAFGKLLQDVFHNRNTEEYKDILIKRGKIAFDLRRLQKKNRKTKKDLQKIKTLLEDEDTINYEHHIIKYKQNSFWYIYIRFFFMFLSILLILGANLSLPIRTISVIAICLFLAIAPALETRAILNSSNKTDVLKSFPGLPGWMLLALLAALFTNPIGYILLVSVLITLQATLLIARGLLWKYRSYDNSDTDTSKYYEYYDPQENGLIKKIGKVEFGPAKFHLMPLLYRYIVFISIPIGFVGLMLINFFNWTRILGGLGTTLNIFVRLLLTGYMGDVVEYALNPTQAHRVRSVVLSELKFFHMKDEVQRIHVFAHSQGTPITYESLYHYLDSNCQNKIYTYITIGSVLSYYHQARGILDPVYHSRFPVYPTKELNLNFADDYKWMNFWNFTDPITEFYGLDEYTSFANVPPDKPEKDYKRTITSPTNRRTKMSLTKNHGEYWTNLEQIAIPFAKRVLRIVPKGRPEEWKPEELKKLKWGSHKSWVLILWGVITAALFTGGTVFFIAGGDDFVVGVFEMFISLLVGIGDIVSNYFPPDGPTIGENLTKLVRILISQEVKDFLKWLLGITYFILAFSAVWEWIVQIRRARLIKKETTT